MKKTGDIVNRYEGAALNPEQQKVYDGIHATLVMGRMVYEAALQEGFSSIEALQLVQTYVSAILAGAAGKQV